MQYWIVLIIYNVLLVDSDVSVYSETQDKISDFIQLLADAILIQYHDKRFRSAVYRASKSR